MARIDELIRGFHLPGSLDEAIAEYGGGHINTTTMVQMREGGAPRKYIVQKINHHVFHHPEEVMQNSVRVTKFLYQEILKEGGDPSRETLRFRKAENGLYYLIDRDGAYWRAYDFIDDTTTLEVVNDPRDMYASGRAFAIFNKRLDQFPVETLHETIPDFHNTPKRFGRLLEVAGEDACRRLETCLPEFTFIKERESDLAALAKKLEAGLLPIRVTHNDTKLNNVLFDKETREGICVIDLDTVMPGLMAYDFGDAIRFGASTAEEDEADLEKVHFSLAYYEAFTRGFLEVLAPMLGEEEKRSLPWGARLMTLEVGIRFLTDYLEGDVYFKIDPTRPAHNLERARTQLKLVAEMEASWGTMEEIVKRYS